MKIIQSFFFFAFCILIIGACGESNSSENATEVTQAQKHDGHNHAGHDHSGHNHDHSGHNHDHGHDHSGHDHNHDHSGHNHDHGHSHDAKTITPEEMEAKKALQAKREKARNEPATAAEKATADKLCQCLTKIPALSKILAANIKDKKTDQAKFDKAVGDNDGDVKAMQQCHATIVRQDLANVPNEDKGIYAFRARKAANQKCLKRDNDDLWYMMGVYLSRQSSPAGQVENLTPRKNPVQGN